MTPVQIQTVIRITTISIFTTVDIIDRKDSIFMVYPVVLVQLRRTLDTPTIAIPARTTGQITGHITTLTGTVSVAEAILTSFVIAQNSVN